ncbi:MAG: CoB--CoM heterodisulfide reductase iron-sulfur subunit A family protein [Thermoplasmata archaeon]|nr:MAG: CoB--CoM heterodisulfide reductase iron-sulfur subunit A family protein [Thermoplasmata archaeon]
MDPKKEKKVGVYICSCYDNITDKIDFDELILHTEKLQGVKTVKKHDSLCSTQGQKFLAEECKNEDFKAVVVAACTPKIYESTIGKGVMTGGLNKYQYEQANIREQCAWVHDDRKEATQKANRLIAGSVARASHLESLDDTDVEVNPSALVIGGGVAGMQSALDIANSGYQVYLVEKSDKLGGRAYELSMTFPTHNCGICCIQSCKNCVLTPKLEDIKQHEKIEILLSSEVEEITGGLGNRYIKIKTPDGIREIDVGIIVIATGSKIFDPSQLSEYGYENDDVISTIELEKLIIAQRDKAGEFSRPSDGKVPKTVNFIQCVGSRDANKGNPHCSLVCCTYALGQAMEIKRRYPGTDVYIHYLDLRGPYRGFEEFYEEAKKAGVNFVRGRVGEVFEEDGKVILRCEDVDAGTPLEIKSDLVVLSVGQEARESTTELAERLHLPLDIDGFIKYMNPMLTPEERRGIFIAGCAQGPKGIRYSIEDARLSAANAIKLLSKETTQIGGGVAFVDEEKCVGCGKCAENCEFGAAQIIIKDGRKLSIVDPVLCQGDGKCSAGCCNKAISIRHFRREQILPMIKAILECKMEV